MQNVETGQLTPFDSFEEMQKEKESNPNSWSASYEIGEKVRVINSHGEEGYFRVNSFGKRFMQLKGISAEEFES